MRRPPTPKSLNPLAGFLKAEGLLVNSPVDPDAVEMVIADYRDWLVTDRGLAEATIVRYEKLARRFSPADSRTASVISPARTSSRSCWLRAAGSVSARSKAASPSCGRC